MEAIKLVQSVKDTLRNTNLKLALAGAAAAAVLAFNAVGGGVAQADTPQQQFTEQDMCEFRIGNQSDRGENWYHVVNEQQDYTAVIYISDTQMQAYEETCRRQDDGADTDDGQDADAGDAADADAADAADEPEAEPEGTEYLCRNYNDRTYVIGTAGADGELNPIDGVNGNFDPEVDEMRIERDAAGAFTADRELVFPVHVNGKEHGSLYITHLGPEIAEGEETTVCQVSDTHPDR